MSGFTKAKAPIPTPRFRLSIMAGLYNDYQDGRRYVIMTTAANKSIINVHDRMPVIVPSDKIYDWITNTDVAFGIMRSPTNTTNNVKVQLSELDSCTFSFSDSMLHPIMLFRALCVVETVSCPHQITGDPADTFKGYALAYNFGFICFWCHICASCPVTML